MDNSPVMDNSSERQRDRSRRGDKGTRFSDANDSGAERDRSANRSGGTSKRIYVSNIPYEYRWQDLKDLFRRVVGTVEFVELFVDENNKPRGCGIVEFKDAENVEKALEKMNRYELSGREIVVKEDHGEERDKYGRIGRKGGDGGGGGGSGGRSGNRSSENNYGGRGDRGRDRSNDNFM
ncbi:Myelin expression factor 2 [Pseudolycoriella hygida]|uniref:Myelin expression factor 2 n=1 Tax=Pseudolycoriella hygida TaxID=35572 RepID=A0A9Q0MSU8_9DIPT|nr:Myelin expression factor 2 [Pseudolycoriella hygida]